MPRPSVIVPDTSVLVDGRVTMLIQRGEVSRCRVLIPHAVVAELEYQANEGRESGFNGLDEIQKIQEVKGAAELEVEFIGARPAPEDIEYAKSGEIDAMIRDLARANDAQLLTSDRVQMHVARAMGLEVRYIRPTTQPEELAADLSTLEIMKFFDDETMSVHLKFDVPPFAKRGKPGTLRLVKLAEAPLELKQLTRMRRELIEAARRDANSFVEIERAGATVVQLGPMRIAIAQPPFSDGLEITAVRPVAKLTLDQYHLDPRLLERVKDIRRGVFVSGPPGSGKSTFVTAIAEYLDAQGAIVKTMESPRDLQVPPSITQYAPLDKKMELTADVLLLVRPDFVIYDEVRKTEDFEIFADMRLAGVGLVGVTHANRGIDAVQRLIGRVELGMIPQVVDTVIHILDGKVQQVLDLAFTVKVPHGMKEADLARPVIEVRDFMKKNVTHEIYTYGEQVVVMPVATATGSAVSSRDRLAATQLKHTLRSEIDGPFDVEFTGDEGIALYVRESAIPQLIGRGGRSIQQLQDRLGLRIDVRPLKGRGGGIERVRPWEGAREEEDEPEAADEDETVAPPRRASQRYAELRPELRKTKKNVVLMLRKDLAGQEVEVVAGDDVLLTATIGAKGEIRLARKSDAADRVLDAIARGDVVSCRV
ncbi:MAG: ATPase, T2SS/T4P/T4SS family [Thermoplasmatota archaeon]